MSEKTFTSGVVTYYSQYGNAGAFIRIDESALAQAELTLIDPEIYQWPTTGLNLPPKFTEFKVYFFNRLIVPRSYRRNGYGKLLLQSITELAVSNRFNILGCPNPYHEPNGLNLTDLVNLYLRFNFRSTNDRKIVYFDHGEKP